MEQFPAILKKVVQREDLTEAESAAVFDYITSGDAGDARVAAILSAMACKGYCAGEVAGATRALRSKVLRIPLADGTKVVDTCGTGGDFRGTFNVSTAAAIIAAGAGVKVVKHGNRSVSSRSGSADVLEALGVNLGQSPEALARCLGEVGLCFAFARAHHPAMKAVAAVRASLGIPTIFNAIGPLTNPAGAKRQLLGASSPRLAELLAEALVKLGCEHAWVVHGEDGLDEISTCAPTVVLRVESGIVTRERILPAELGLAAARHEDLQVPDAQASARAISELLDGQPGPRADIALVNAAAAILLGGLASSLAEGLSKARESIRSGASRKVLAGLTRFGAG